MEFHDVDLSADWRDQFAGLELEGKMSLDARTNLTLAYTYLDAEIKDDVVTANVGNRPSNVPEHTASAWLDYTIPEHGVFGDLTIGGACVLSGHAITMMPMPICWDRIRWWMPW